MQRLLAIVWLTWKAAFRFRLFIVITILLLGAVVGLPLLIKDDGTARGFTQILVTYTLSAITGLLGISTLWLSCGTLAREIEECQMQVVATKPIARWQIWLGKWVGIMSLNALLLAISGGCVYGLLMYRASRLPQEQQQVLRNEVLVARGAARPESKDAEIERRTDELLEQKLRKLRVEKADLQEVRRQIREQVKATYSLVPPGYTREWKVDLGFARTWLQDQPLFLRIKFNAAEKSASGTYEGVWRAGVPRETSLWQSDVLSLAPDTFIEIKVDPNTFDKNGVLTLGFLNPPNSTALLFPIEDGIEVLYRQGGFGPNFARGLTIIFCWMALLSALGLAASSFLTFPVAAFVSLALLVVVFCSGTMANAVEEGTIANYNAEKGVKGFTPADLVVIPAFRGMLTIIGLAKDFSPVDSLSTGRMITWTQLGQAAGQIIGLLSGAIALFGMAVFTRRELATAQGTQ